MLPLILIVLALALGRLRGGRVRHLGQLRIRALGLFFAAFAIQLALFSSIGAAVVDTVGPGFIPTLYIASNVLVAIGLWLNRGRLGFIVCLVGVLLNTLTIAANGGYMPLAPEGLAALDNPDRAQAFARDEPYNNSRLLTPETRLSWLGDIFVLRRLGEVYSPGDVFIFAGLALVVLEGMGVEVLRHRGRPT